MGNKLLVFLGTSICLLIFMACEDRHSSLDFEWKEVLVSQGDHIQSIVAKDSMIFAATRFHAVLSTSDSGYTWNEKNNGITNTWLTTLAKDDSFIYAGARELYIFRSSDNGETWADANLGLSHILGELTSSVVRGSTLFVGTLQHGISYSTDRGDHWNKVNNSALTHINTLFADGDTVYAGTYHGVYYCPSSDSVWLPLHSELENQSIVSIGKAGTNLLIGTNDVNYKYTQYGELLELTGGVSDDGMQVFCGFGANILAGVYSQGIYLSTDGGTHWKNVSGNLSGLPVLSISIVDSTVFVGSENKIHTMSINELMR